jgi:hypothetical protein
MDREYSQIKSINISLIDLGQGLSNIKLTVLYINAHKQAVLSFGVGEI